MAPECRPNKKKEVDPFADFPEAPEVAAKEDREQQRLVDPFDQFQDQPSIDQTRERGRLWLALCLLATFLVIEVLAFCLWPREDLKEVFHASMPMVTAFLGMAIGFYFSAEKKK